MKFSLQTRELLLGITGELLWNYWRITEELRLFVYQGYKKIVFELTSPSLLTPYLLLLFNQQEGRKRYQTEMLSDQEVRSSMLSTVSVTSVTSGKIFSSEEAKPTSLIGTTIFNNVFQFIIGEEEKFREIVRSARNVSRDYKLSTRETVPGPLIDKCFDNHTKNQREKLLNGEDIYGFNFKGDGATIKENPYLISCLGGFSYMCQFKILWTVQVTSHVFTIRMLNFLRRVYLIQ